MQSNMITLANVYHVLEATVPLYAVMILAYLSIKLWKLFTPDQCSGINRFVAKFSIPLLSFHVISTNNPYQMNLKLLLSDTVQKLFSLLIFAILCKICFNGNIDSLITGFSLSTLPNTLVVGIPLLTGMYGVDAAGPLGQIVVLQSLIWYAVLLFLFEYRAATIVPATRNGDAEQHTITQEEEVRVLSSKHRNLHILLIAGRKLATNPNTCSSLAGLVWALISFRWRLKLPRIISSSISLISDGGLGMAMFSLGLFTASQSKIIACGTRMMVLCIGLRFIIGPALMAAPSYATGLRNKLLDVAIVQAALPQGIVPFVLAKEYGLHPDILSTGVIIGMALALPVGLGYYFLLDPH